MRAALCLVAAINLSAHSNPLTPSAEFNLNAGLKHSPGRTARTFFAATSNQLTLVTIEEDRVLLVSADLHGRILHSRSDLSSVGAQIYEALPCPDGSVWLVAKAYDVQFYQIDGPDWINTERYELDAKVPPGATRFQLRLMLQNLLKDRFQLSLHREARDLPTYVLTVEKGGPKMQHADPESKPMGAVTLEKGHLRLTGRNEPIETLTSMLKSQLRAPVMDETGLAGEFDFALEFITDETSTETAQEEAPELITALRMQLGLKLQARKGPVEVLILDHAQKVPTEN